MALPSALTTIETPYSPKPTTEESLPKVLGVPAQAITHLEAAEDHHVVPRDEHYTGRPG